MILLATAVTLSLATPPECDRCALGIGSHSDRQVTRGRSHLQIQEAGFQPISTKARAHLVVSLGRAPSPLSLPPLRWGSAVGTGGMTARTDGACWRNSGCMLSKAKNSGGGRLFRICGHLDGHRRHPPGESGRRVSRLPIHCFPKLLPAARPVVTAAQPAPPIFLDHFVAWDAVEERYRHAASLRVEGLA